uniref:Gametocyte-specific factor 1 n=1 Tax=Schizaphis graminum TaxID=13262 RepID=A0A2S2N945_SCHGA
MPYKTLLLHIKRCPNKKKGQEICPFNFHHIVDEQFIEEHKRQCRDLSKYEKKASNNDRVNKFEYVECPDSIESTWDDEDYGIVQSVQRTSPEVTCHSLPTAITGTTPATLPPRYEGTEKASRSGREPPQGRKNRRGSRGNTLVEGRQGR